MNLRLAVVLGLLAWVLLGMPGCAQSQRECDVTMYRRPPADRRPAPPPSHGGAANVNAAAHDAMFFRNYGVNPPADTDEEPLSTFAVDVDTGSYTLCRSYLNEGHLPPADAVRVEEFVNYFNYGYAPPEPGGEPFALHLEAAPSKFRPGKVLLRVGLKAREVDAEDREPCVLTFVIDTSGSMDRENRLELVKKSVRLLLDTLDEGDRVGLVAFGTTARVVLEPRGLEDRDDILDALDRLHPEGSTNAEDGLRLGYEMARRAMRRGLVNRVILCSDGVANQGRTGAEGILKSTAARAAEGITLSTVGFGMGNYNDVLMEQLADKGRGNYAYVDSLREARRIFVRKMVSTLQVVARDVKVQVAFNPDRVRSSRLLGYENRGMDARDFRNDRVDGGAVGAGHSVTAVYELKLWPEKAGRLATVHVRYKTADGHWAREMEGTADDRCLRPRFDAASDSFKLAAAVSEFAEVLRGSPGAREVRLADVAALARECRAQRGDRAELGEFVRLVETACALRGDSRAAGGESEEE